MQTRTLTPADAVPEQRRAPQQEQQPERPAPPEGPAPEELAEEAPEPDPEPAPRRPELGGGGGGTTNLRPSQLVRLPSSRSRIDIEHDGTFSSSLPHAEPYVPLPP